MECGYGKINHEDKHRCNNERAPVTRAVPGLIDRFHMRSGYMSLAAWAVRISSPNKVLAQANHLRVKREASLREKDSCMKPVPACVAFNIARESAISLGSRVVSARVMMPSGQIMPRPAWKLPSPTPAEPR